MTIEKFEKLDLKEIKVVKVFWDNQDRYAEIPKSLYKKLYNATHLSMGQFDKTWYADDHLAERINWIKKQNDENFVPKAKIISIDEIIIVKDLNDIVKKLKDIDYTHMILMPLGCIMVRPQKLAHGIYKQVMNYPEANVSGHIMHTGLWEQKAGRDQYQNLFTMHEQMLMLSKQAIDNIKNDNFVFNNTIRYHTNDWIKIARSIESVHDDYTPLKIYKDTFSNDKIVMKKERNNFGFCEDLIQYAMRKDWTIYNLNDTLRASKLYSYHNDRTDEFIKYSESNMKDIEEDNDKKNIVDGHYRFFKALKSHTQDTFFGYNNELISKELPRTKYDSFVGVASGFLPWLYLSKYHFDKNTKVFLIDINETALKFQKWFLQNYNPDIDQTWKDIVEQFAEVYNTTSQGPLFIGDEDYVEQSNKIWKQQKIELNSKWNEIKNYTYEYKCDSIMKSKPIEDFIKDKQRPMLWLSNVFNYRGNWFTETNFESYLNDLISANRLVQWIGATPYGPQSTGPGSKTVTGKKFYSQKTFPEFDVEQFLNEINLLEENKLFTDHRGGGHPGWSSFVVHGIDWNKTLHYDHYGYTSDEETPYKFTDKAREYIPSIVKYFEENQEHFHRIYHRVRIMKLAPGGYIGIHNDNPNEDTWALNMAINNPNGCEMHFWTKKYEYLGQVPWTPQSSYKIRIGLNHMVRNMSKEIRYHMIIHGRHR